MANFFSGYSGSKAADATGATIPTTTGSTKGMGGKSFFKGYSGQKYDPNYTPPSNAAPAPPSGKGNSGLVKTAIDFLSPAFQQAKALASSGGKILTVLPNDIKAITGIATHNPVAAKNAFDAATAGMQEIKTQAVGALQAGPRLATHLAISIPGNPLKRSAGDWLLGADHTYTPHGTIAKFLLGDAPVQSFHNAYSADKAQGGSTAHATGQVFATVLNDLLTAKAGKEGLSSVKGALTAPLDKALNDYNGLRTQAAISQLPKEVGGAGTALPAGEKPLQLPARSVTNPVKETPGPNGGTFGGAKVSDATAHQLTLLDQAVKSTKSAGDTIDHVQKISNIANLRERAVSAANALVRDHAQLLKDLHKETGGVSLIKEDGMVTGRVSSNDPFYAKVFKETGKPPKAADWLQEAQRQLATGKTPEAQHYQTALNIADKAHQAYVDHIGNAKVSDIYKQNASPEQVAALEQRLAAVQEQAKREVRGQNQGPQVETAKPAATADQLRKNFANLEQGKSVASHVQALNDLIQHPDIPQAEKQAYINLREELKPSVTNAPPPAAAAPVASNAPAPTAVGAPSMGAVAQDYTHGAETQAPGAPTPPAGPPLRTSPLTDAELIAQAAKTAGPVNPARNIVGEIQRAFDPAPGPEGMVVKHDLRAAVGDLEMKKAQMSLGTQGEVKFWDKQAPVDNLTFIHTMEEGRPQPTPMLEAKAAAFRDWFNEDHKLATTLKADLPYLKDYFTHNGLWKDPKAAEVFFDKWQKQSLGGSPGALEHRSFPTIVDGLKNGLEIKETNPQVLANANRASLLRAKMAQDFQAEASAKGMSPATVQRVLDRYLGRGFKDSSIYQSARQIGNTLNQAQLSLSGFHVTGTAINSVLSQFSTGLNDILRLHPIKGTAEIATSPFAPLRNILQGDKILKDFKNNNITADIKNIAEGGGRIGQPVEFKATGISKSLEQITSGTVSGVVKGTINAPLRALSTAAKPVMEWWVPRLKLGAAKDLIDAKISALGKDAAPEVIRAAKAEAIDSIDNRFGQLVKDNIFWDQHIKDISHMAMRSPGWNIGTVREVGGGAFNFLKPSTYLDLAKGKGLPESSSYALSLGVGVALMGGTLQFLYTGKWPTSPKDYFYPKTGQVDKNGNEERVSLPTYAKDIYSFIHNPTQTMANKANPAVSESLQLGTNKDYFGNQIRNPQDDASTQANQVKDYLIKSNLPFSVTGANNRVEQNASTKAQSFAGINPAPGYVTKSKFEQDVQSALNQALGTKSLTPEQAALIQEKSKAKAGARGGDMALVDQMVSTGKITKKQGENLKTSSKGSSLQNSFNYLLQVDRGAAAELLLKASPDDLKTLGDPAALRSQMFKSLRSKNISPATRQATQKILLKLGK